MSDARDEDIEMRQHALDDDWLDRLLSGRIPPDDAPPGLSSVAALFCAASGPATAEEFDREAEVVTAGAMAIRTSRTPSASMKRRSPVLAKLLSAKFAAVAAVAVLGAGTTAAAATGNLPTHKLHPRHPHNAHLARRHHPKTGTIVIAHHPGKSMISNTSITAVVPNTARRVIPAGTASAGHSTFGLCTAYLASGQGSGHNASAPPFKALIAAHGGPAGTTTFCHAFVTAHHPGMSTSSTGSTTPVLPTMAPRHGIPALKHGTPADTPASTMPGRPATTQTPVSTGPATTEPPATSPPATAGNAPVVTHMPGTNTAHSAGRGNGASGSNGAGTASGGASSSGPGITFNHT